LEVKHFKVPYLEEFWRGLKLAQHIFGPDVIWSSGKIIKFGADLI